MCADSVNGSLSKYSMIATLYVMSEVNLSAEYPWVDS